MINPISVSVSGLQAASKKAEVTANNIVNADTVGSRDPNSPQQAYKPQTVQNLSVEGGGVRAVSLDRQPSFVPSYSPDSPFADEEGLINAPNVNLDEELINLKLAENAYKANTVALKTGIEMADTLREALDTKS